MVERPSPFSPKGRGLVQVTEPDHSVTLWHEPGWLALSWGGFSCPHPSSCSSACLSCRDPMSRAHTFSSPMATVLDPQLSLLNLYCRHGSSFLKLLFTDPFFHFPAPLGSESICIYPEGSSFFCLFNVLPHPVWSLECPFSQRRMEGTAGIITRLAPLPLGLPGKISRLPLTIPVPGR